MGLILSNALYQVGAWLASAASAPSGPPASGPASAPASAPATAPAAAGAGLSPLLVCLASLGVFILAAYGIHRWARPGKLRLANAPRRHNNLTGLHLCIVFAVMILLPAGVSGVLGRWMPPRSTSLEVPISSGPPVWRDMGTQRDPRELILSGLIFQALFLPVCIGAAWMAFPMGLGRGLGLSARHWFLDGLRAVVAYLAVFPVCLFLWWVGTQFRGYQEHSMLMALRGAGAEWKVLVVLSAVILTPVVEEILFRGLLQSLLRNYFRGAWPAVLLASVFFAAMHGSTHWFPALFVLGVVLGYNYERTGRLLAPILIHALFNGVTIVNALVYG